MAASEAEKYASSDKVIVDSKLVALMPIHCKAVLRKSMLKRSE